MEVDETLEDRFNAITGRLNATHAELVDLTVEVLQDPDNWGSWECHSVEKFVAWRSGMQIAAAGKIVQIARRVDDLPLCLEAFRDGRLSLDQLAPIAKRVPWYADEEFCRQAQMMTVGQIQRTASKFPWDRDIPKPDGSIDHVDRPSPVDDPTADDDADADADQKADTDVGEEADADAGSSDTDAGERPDGDVSSNPSHAEDTLHFWWDDQQRLHLYGEFDGAAGSIIENALTEARDSLFQDGRVDVDWADALLEMAERSLGRIESPARRSRFRTHIHRNVDGTTTNATGCALDDAVADYISCDSLRSDVHEVGGVPISVGRSRHTVPERTRRTVIHRDGGCGVPGCGDTRWLDVHHIIHWAHGGPTDTDNLIALCNKHHRLHHQARLGITGHADDPNGMTFTNRHGQPIRGSGARPQPPGERSATGTPEKAYRPALRETLQSRWQHFNPPLGFRPFWDHDLQQTVNPRRHPG